MIYISGNNLDLQKKTIIPDSICSIFGSSLR